MKFLQVSTLLTVLSLGLVGCPAEGGARYFEVGERTPVHHDSFILPLTKEADIAHARALIAKPEATGAPIVTAQITRGGSDGPYVNRNLAGDGAPWSWRVTSFEGFADFTIEVLDAWPTYVEDHYDDFTASSGGRIGFWNYTIVREVPAAELAVAGFHLQYGNFISGLFQTLGLVY